MKLNGAATTGNGDNTATIGNSNISSVYLSNIAKIDRRTGISGINVFPANSDTDFVQRSIYKRLSHTKFIQDLWYLMNLTAIINSPCLKIPLEILCGVRKRYRRIYRYFKRSLSFRKNLVGKCNKPKNSRKRSEILLKR
jgi:hypothetical protein